MRKVFKKTAWYVLLNACAALVLSVCVIPVGVETFLEDDKVQEIITNGKTEAIVDIVLPKIEDSAPVLTVSGTPMSVVNGIGTIIVSAGDSLTVKVSNAAGYGSITWYCNDPIIHFETGDTLTITAGMAPFNSPRTSLYLVTVEGEANGIGYSTFFHVIVEG